MARLARPIIPPAPRLAEPFIHAARSAGRALLDLLYPPSCPGCGRLGQLFCPQCRALVRTYSLLCCPRCGRPSAARELCAACAAVPSPLDAILPGAVFAPVFAHPIRPAIHDFKYEGVTDLAAPLAEWLAATWRLHRLAADLIVPVPLHPQRERERGYNQSALLAKQLSAAVAVPVAPAALVRIVRTRPQVGLTQEQRRANIAGAFRCARIGGSRCARTGAFRCARIGESRCARDVTDLRIVLVDDVCTTGSTLEACAAELRAAGAAAVWGLTVARPSFEASSALLPPDDPALPD
ncbi:MAG: ComF family protein [Anaerolineae bacterium]|nr:ComF family protein [Anaerolineae bacterium]